MHPHEISSADNPGTNTDITGVDTSAHSVEIPNPPTGRPISDRLGSRIL